jgi:hypothetical protein
LGRVSIGKRPVRIDFDYSGIYLLGKSFFQISERRRRMKRTVVICVMALSLCLSCWAVPADAYERGRPWLSDQPWEKFGVDFGFFLTTFNSTIALSGVGSGVYLNLEDTLGLESTTKQWRVMGHYRAWRRHHFHFCFYDLSRSTDKYLEGSITNPGNEDGPPLVAADALVESHLDLRVYKIGYSFSFWNDDRVDLGVGLGFHIMDIAAGINVLGEGSAGGVGGPIDYKLLAEDTTLPLPVLMLRGNVAITKRVFLKGSLDAFYISLSGFEGLLLDANLALEGHICRFFGLGLGYNFMKIEIEGDGGDDFLGGGWNGKLNLDVSGLFLYAKFFF